MAPMNQDAILTLTAFKPKNHGISLNVLTVLQPFAERLHALQVRCSSLLFEVHPQIGNSMHSPEYQFTVHQDIWRPLYVVFILELDVIFREQDGIGNPQFFQLRLNNRTMLQ